MKLVQVPFFLTQPRRLTWLNVSGLHICYNIYNWVVATQIFFYVHPENWGRWTHFDERMFQLGWFNHQLDKVCTFALKTNISPKNSQVGWWFISYWVNLVSGSRSVSRMVLHGPTWLSKLNKELLEDVEIFGDCRFANDDVTIIFWHKKILFWFDMIWFSGVSGGWLVEGVWNLGRIPWT